MKRFRVRPNFYIKVGEDGRISAVRVIGGNLEAVKRGNPCYDDLARTETAEAEAAIEIIECDWSGKPV